MKNYVLEEKKFYDNLDEEDKFIYNSYFCDVKNEDIKSYFDYKNENLTNQEILMKHLCYIKKVVINNYEKSILYSLGDYISVIILAVMQSYNKYCKEDTPYKTFLTKKISNELYKNYMSMKNKSYIGMYEKQRQYKTKRSVRSEFLKGKEFKDSDKQLDIVSYTMDFDTHILFKDFREKIIEIIMALPVCKRDIDIYMSYYTIGGYKFIKVEELANIYEVTKVRIYQIISLINEQIINYLQIKENNIFANILMDAIDVSDANFQRKKINKK